jgi:hypothetical protein
MVVESMSILAVILNVFLSIFDKPLYLTIYAGLGSMVQTLTESKVPSKQHSRGKTELETR